MYAVILQGGHQYRVQPGEVIQVELLDTDSDEIVLDNVLAVHDGSTLKLGEPRLANASVKAKVVREGKGTKITIYKFKRRKGYSRKIGHRQPFVELRILSISLDGAELTAAN